MTAGSSTAGSRQRVGNRINIVEWPLPNSPTGRACGISRLGCGHMRRSSISRGSTDASHLTPWPTPIRPGTFNPRREYMPHIFLTSPREHAGCPNCSYGLYVPTVCSLMDESATPKHRDLVEVGDDLQCPQCEATFEVTSVRPLKFSLLRRPPAHKMYPGLDELGLVRVGMKVFLRDPARVFEVVDRALIFHRKVTLSVTLVLPSVLRNQGCVVEVLDVQPPVDPTAYLNDA